MTYDRRVLVANLAAHVRALNTDRRILAHIGAAHLRALGGRGGVLAHKLAVRLHAPGGDRGVLAGNVAARIGALVALGLATILIARTGGPSAVGIYALLRVLPGLFGVVVSCGLPGATPYFLAAKQRDPRLRPTIVAATWLSALAATGLWVAATPLLHQLFFRTLSWPLVALVGTAVFTQLFVAVSRSCLQGEEDMTAASVAIAAEEIAFLPAYAVLMPFVHGNALLLAALVVADVAVTAGVAVRLIQRGFTRGWGRPSRPLALKVAHFGMRGQVGGVMELMNLRLDFAILGAIAGPAVLGTYAVASKYAELLRLPGLALTYVLYPRFARSGHSEARRQTARWLPRLAVLGVLAAVPLFVLAKPVIPLLYGAQFDSAVAPTYVLLLGLSGATAAGLLSGYLYGEGHPGLNSAALATGLVVTAALDAALIPHFGAMGAAWASTAAYVVTAATLLLCFWWLGRSTTKAAPSALIGVP